MLVRDFDFALPAELIAQHPAQPRESARLLRIAAELGDYRVGDLPALLRHGDLLVVNDTKVLPTRFWGRRGDVPIEATLVEAIDAARWWSLCRPGKRLRPGDRLELGRSLRAIVEAKDEDGRVQLAFAFKGAALLRAIEAEGAMPLPPYIHRTAGGDPADRSDYQPIFARVPGSVASPTASLHFTPALDAALAARGIERVALTLHVGMGTFAPIKVEDTDAHRMHSEWYEVPSTTAGAIERARTAGRRIVAVGTTVLRALESACDEEGRVSAKIGTTSIFITPGWRLRTSDLLLTNFHLPRSTLFMLVCAFGGTARLRAAYAHAIARKYRFFSFGDACLMERGSQP